jgi:catechol 2,3-dioxygenase-like lactoylglutathione lyase family enzyme
VNQGRGAAACILPGVLVSLDHAILAVRDLGAATAQYARLLGWSPSWRGEHRAAGTANALSRLKNTYIELLSPDGDGPQGRALSSGLEAQGEGLIGLAFGTDDACHSFFEGRGLEPEAIEKGLGRDVESGAFREWRRIPLPGENTRGVMLFAIEHLSAGSTLTPGLPAGDERAAIFGLDHAVVRTADAEAAKALYGDGLGLRLALDRTFPQWGARLLFFRLGGITLEVAAAVTPDSAEADGKPVLSSDRDQLWGLSFRVRDADGARARLDASGFDVSKVREGRKPGTRVFSVRDGTCGVPTLILQPADRFSM